MSQMRSRVHRYNLTLICYVYTKLLVPGMHRAQIYHKKSDSKTHAAPCRTLTGVRHCSFPASHAANMDTNTMRLPCPRSGVILCPLRCHLPAMGIPTYLHYVLYTTAYSFLASRYRETAGTETTANVEQSALPTAEASQLDLYHMVHYLHPDVVSHQG